MKIGDYEIERTLGVGESSTVYLAAGPIGSVALKVLHPNYGGDPVIAERFITDAQTLADMNDPGVARVFDVLREFDANEPVVGMVMEYLPGGTLRDRGSAEPRGLLRDLLRSLSALHAVGIVHRDISPSHIAFGADGRPRLIDFTGASVRDLAGLSRSTVHTVRRVYADPHAWGLGSSTPTQDLYSVGAVVHELLFGAPPVPPIRGVAKAPLESTDDSYLASIVTTMTGEPRLRPRSAEEVLGWLDAGAEILDGRVTECLYCGAIMPADAVLCLECGHEPPRIQKDPNGEFLALRKISEEQAVLGPFLRTLSLLAAGPPPDFHLILGDARMYSREERERGYELPVRIADSIAPESVLPLIRLLTGPAPDRIHVERYPMSRLRKVKRGPLITLGDRRAPPSVGIEALRRAARRRHAEMSVAASSRKLRSQFLHALGIASRRIGDLASERMESLIAAFEAVFDSYDALARTVEARDLHAAYADLERQQLSDETAGTDTRAVFEEHAEAVRRLSAIEATVSRLSLALESVTPDDATEVLSRVGSQLERSIGARGYGTDRREPDAGSGT